MNDIAGCSDLRDITADESGSWCNVSELTLMLHHPGPRPQPPIAPVTLLALATSRSSFADPTLHQQQQGEEDAKKGLDGLEAEILTVLVWVHPAAAREAWQILRECAQSVGISCDSRLACHKFESAHRDCLHFPPCFFALPWAGCFYPRCSLQPAVELI